MKLGGELIAMGLPLKFRLPLWVARAVYAIVAAMALNAYAVMPNLPIPSLAVALFIILSIGAEVDEQVMKRVFPMLRK